jgi:hypothetical protein
MRVSISSLRCSGLPLQHMALVYKTDFTDSLEKMAEAQT